MDTLFFFIFTKKNSYGSLYYMICGHAESAQRTVTVHAICFVVMDNGHPDDRVHEVYQTSFFFIMLRTTATKIFRHGGD